MKMAVAVQCHSDPEQVNRIIRFFDDEDIDVYIHIDKKSNIGDFIDYRNVNIVNNPVDVKWGDYSQIEATLKLFELIRLKGINYDYVHLISGNDYPIKSIREFKNFFSENDEEYIEVVHLPNDFLPKGGIDRYNVFYPRWMIDRPTNVIKRLVRVLYRELILNSKVLMRNNKRLKDIYYGSQWFSITGKCMNYILDYLYENKWFSDFFENSIYPDEMFFQTIIMNSEFKTRVKNNNLRYIDWTEQKASPKELSVADINYAIDSKLYFARKINDITVINYIESKV